MLGESPAAQRNRIEEASKGANDLTGLVKKKKPATGDLHKTTESEFVKSNGKRKANFDEQAEDAGTEKRAKSESGKEG